MSGTRQQGALRARERRFCTRMRYGGGLDSSKLNILASISILAPERFLRPSAEAR